ncbi:hypothetical protein [Bavariicoccus seileri]|nr:hypothetical protein [Bavariicoccus seileri]
MQSINKQQLTNNQIHDQESFLGDSKCTSRSSFYVTKMMYFNAVTKNDSN